MDDVLDRGDHGVGGLVEDLRVLVGRRCEYGHALVALLGVGGSSAHRAHLVLGRARVGSCANHEHGRAFQRREVRSEFAVTASISITTSADSAGDIRAERPSAARMRMIHPNRRNWVRTFCFPASSNMAIGYAPSMSTSPPTRPGW